MTKEYKMNDEDMEWVENALKRGFTKLQMRKKLAEVKYPEEKVEMFCSYYDELVKETEPEKVFEHEDDFEDSVKKWHEGKKSELSWEERRAVKRFLKQMNKYLIVLKATSESMRKEVLEIKRRFEGDSKAIEKELDNVKEELVDRIIESKSILDIADPKTGKEATKDLLMKNDLDTLINFFDNEIVKDVDAVVNGRVE